LRFFFLIFFSWIVTVPLVIGDVIYRDVEFTIAPCSGPDAHKVVSYLAFMRTPLSEYQIQYMNAVAEIPANETYFRIKNLPAGDYCFVVAGLLDDGRITKHSAEGCVESNDFLFGDITLRFKV